MITDCLNPEQFHLFVEITQMAYTILTDKVLLTSSSGTIHVWERVVTEAGYVMCFVEPGGA